MVTQKMEKRYLLLPVDNTAQNKKLRFYEGEGEGRKLVLDLDFRPASGNADFIVSYDARELCGKSVYFECDCDAKITQSDRKAPKGEDELRPFVHFTPEVGWNNDPNGMIKYGDEYHLFYQYNPCGRDWGNLHWGHAVSRDLVQWEEKDTALFPDRTGTMFSGSAIEDERNVTGLKKGENNPLLLFYTAAGGTSELSQGAPFTQRLAYSTDGGVSFIKTDKAVIEHISASNRDPKVVWAEEIGKYLLALYLTNGEYALFTSENLIDWELLQKLSIEGDRECPDIYAFRRGEKIYRALIGASDHYIIGEFSGGKFVPITKTKKLNVTRCPYAAQSFSGTGDRVLRMCWNNIGSPRIYSASEIGLVQEITLCGEGEKMCLNVMPARETEKLNQSKIYEGGIPAGKPVTVPLEKSAYRVEIVCDRSYFSFCAFGLEMRFNAKKNVLSVGETVIPLDKSNKIAIVAFIDKCSTEIYLGGKSFVCIPHTCDYSKAKAEYACEGATQKLSVIRLKNIFG